MKIYEMSLTDLSKEIEKTERPMYILKVRRRGSNIHNNDYIDHIGPFYTIEEIAEYFKDKLNLTYFDLNYFKKHKTYYSNYVYELVKLTL